MALVTTTSGGGWDSACGCVSWWSGVLKITFSLVVGGSCWVVSTQQAVVPTMVTVGGFIGIAVVVGLSVVFIGIEMVMPDFVSRERVVWVDIKGVPLHAWSHSTFIKIGSRWGEVLELEENKDDCFARKRICIKTKQEDNILEKFKIIVRGKVFVLRAKELFVWSPMFKDLTDDDFCSDDDSVKGDAINNNDNESGLNHLQPLFLNAKEKSSDPFNLYDLLDKHKLNKQDKCKVNSTSDSSIPYPPGFTPENAYNFSDPQKVKDVECHMSQNRSNGFSSRIMEDAQPSNDNFHPLSPGAGHKSNKGGSILEVLDDMVKVGKSMGFSMEGYTKDMEQTKMDCISDMDIRVLWGNHNFDYTISEAVGNSGVRCLEDRMGSIFNVQGANEFNSFISNSGLVEIQLEGIFDQGGVTNDLLLSRLDILKQLQDIQSSESHDCIQKDKIQWAVEGVMVDGVWVDDPVCVKEEFRSHFANRFRAPVNHHCKLNFIFPNRLSPYHVGDLERPVTKDEVRTVVWGCGKNKSPGPDGYTFEFFCNSWDIIGSDLFEAVEWFFVHCSFTRGCNSSFVALIPKTHDPKFVSNYRPIGLIGSLYKVITKILANRLSFVISDLISDVQTAFLPNRQILDGPFIINDLLSWCKSKKQQAMVFKVDFAKAYDSIRWDYLDEVLRAFGFGSKWRSWIGGSLCSGMASILLNGSPTLEFQFHCGLKQGDPLAPYLFIIIMKSLYLSFSRAVDEGIFMGIKIDSSLNISHLFTRMTRCLLESGRRQTFLVLLIFSTVSL
ncbi:RNA-directed DNA polymerase, eukaryota, partial [Tanacetum coccineum]